MQPDFNPDEFVASTVACAQSDCPSRDVAFTVAHPPGGLILCGACGTTLIDRSPNPEDGDLPDGH
ncbi:hypothetical protein FB461_1937 [Rarobacter faecitabidus]|uniref:Uncharacterized protein n=1 Tax=Rarobacter faecitabidus TaxID=13243 RepID=A0A542ZDV4_RARFA|nr:hypothetical protein FB461_1937 [Rarobacter faecitabidus]